MSCVVRVCGGRACVLRVSVVYVLRVCVCVMCVLCFVCCGVLLCVCVCRYVWCWCWCWCAMCGVWCLWCTVCCLCVARLGTRNPPVCRYKTSPCVGSKRIRVYRQNARMCSTCARFASTHGSVLNVHTETFLTNTRIGGKGGGVGEGGGGFSSLSFSRPSFSFSSLFLFSLSLSCLLSLMLNTCARFAGTHGGVLNRHTETF